jgi:hypothetical protein
MVKNKNIQFSLEPRQANESGQLHIERKHYPVFGTSLTSVHYLSSAVDYSLICENQKTYNGLHPNTKYYILMWQEID